MSYGRPGGTGQTVRSIRPLWLCLLLLASCLSTAGASDDTLWYRTLGVENGLSQSFVTAMLADHDGFMWFGTQIGLDRWNGYDVESFRHDPDRTDSLSAQTVLALHIDRAGRLWVGTTRGLDYFDPALNAFRRYGSLFHDPRGGPLRVEAITSDRAGRVWFAWHGGSRLYQLDPRTGRGREYPLPGAAPQLVTALVIDGADRLWVATRPDSTVPSSGPVSPQVLGFDRCSDISGDA
jgi:ligand-binding sensor domain-containing protein